MNRHPKEYAEGKIDQHDQLRIKASASRLLSNLVARKCPPVEYVEPRVGITRNRKGEVTSRKKSFLHPVAEDRNKGSTHNTQDESSEDDNNGTFCISNEGGKYLLKTFLKLLHDTDNALNTIRIATDSKGLAVRRPSMVSGDKGDEASGETTTTSSSQETVSTEIVPVASLTNKIRWSTIGALQNLSAFSLVNCKMLTNHERGFVLTILVKTIVFDDHVGTRQSAAQTLLNIVSPETAEAMGDHPGLVGALANIACSSGTKNNDVRENVSTVLSHLSADVHAPMDCHSALLNAFGKIAQRSPGMNISRGLASDLLRQACHPANRKAVARHNVLMEALVITAGASKEAKSRLDRRRSVGNMTTMNNSDQTPRATPRDYALATLKILVCEPSNIDIMSRQAGVIEVMTEAARKEASEHRLKNTDKNTLLPFMPNIAAKCVLTRLITAI